MIVRGGLNEPPEKPKHACLFECNARWNGIGEDVDPVEARR